MPATAAAAKATLLEEVAKAAAALAPESRDLLAGFAELTRSYQGEHYVFKVRDRRRIKGRAVVLVDDVLTTGATSDACARVLQRAGAASVGVLTFARVVRDAGRDIAQSGTGGGDSNVPRTAIGDEDAQD